MKLALVTGASSGIGAEAARELAQAGFRVVLVARGAAELARVAEGIGPAAVVEPCDAADGPAVLALAERLRQEPLQHTETWLASTGCEETGCDGMLALLGGRSSCTCREGT